MKGMNELRVLFAGFAHAIYSKDRMLCFCLNDLPLLEGERTYFRSCVLGVSKFWVTDGHASQNKKAVSYRNGLEVAATYSPTTKSSTITVSGLKLAVPNRTKWHPPAIPIHT